MSAQGVFGRALSGTEWLFPVLLFVTVLVLVSGPGAVRPGIGHADVAFAAIVGDTGHDWPHAGNRHPKGHRVAAAALPVAPVNRADRLRIANVTRPGVRLHAGLAPGPGHRPPIFRPQG